MWNVFSKIYYWGISHVWALAFVENDIQSILQGDRLKYILVKNPYKDRWFADPFIIDVSDTNYTLLVEEFLYELDKGRISKLTVDRRSMEITNSETVLELDTHLSFPAILRCGDDIFIYPENSDANELALYKYNKVENKFYKIKRLSNSPLTDAIFCRIKGNLFILSTQLPNPNRNELGIYSLNEKSSLFELEQKYLFKDNVARNGGGVILFQGKMYKVSQNCNRGYGCGLVIHQIIYDEQHNKWNFLEVTRIFPDSKRYDLGIHTLNIYKGHAVIDLKGYHFPYIGKIFSFLRKFYFK